jgi:hypothetical protein
MSSPEEINSKLNPAETQEKPSLHSRRTFIQTLGTTVGSAMLAPGLNGAMPESGYPQLAQLRDKHQQKGIILPDKTYRTMELSLHLPPEGRFEIDVPGAMGRARDAGTETVLLYAQDHWGHALYTSDVGVRHPNLKGDFFGTEVEAARKLGMSVIGYYSLQFNTQIVMKHPDWGWVNEKGEPERWRWNVTCLDTPYRQYVLGMIDEMFARYELDELFLDIFGIQFVGYHGSGRNPFCFCKYTEAAWDKDHPGDPYREGFATREGWERRYRWHQKRSMTDMLDEIIAAMRKHKPKAMIGLNGGPEAFPDDIQQRVSFLYAEPIPSATGIALGTILLRGWGRPDYQAGVWNAYDYVDTNRSAVSRVQADALLVQNARTFYIGEAPMVSGMNGGKGYSDRWFNIAKDAWQDVRNVDCLLEGAQPVLSSAVFYSQGTQDELAAQKRPVDFRNSMLGTLELLTFTGRPVESIPEFRLNADLLNQFDTFVLPDVEVLSDAHAEIIRKWVANGGTLLASGKCGLRDEKHQERSNFALADVFGVDYLAEERKYAFDADGKPKERFISTYIESSGHELASNFDKETVGLPGPFVTVNRRSAEEVMRYRLPYMVEDKPNFHWYNWFSPPPGSELGGSAVTCNKVGKGKAIYFGVPIFRSEANKSAYDEPIMRKGRPVWIRDWIPALIRRLVPNPVAEVRSEPFSECVYGTCFWDKSKRSILVQVLNTNELLTEGEPRKAPPVRISVDSRRLALAGARTVWPNERALKVERKNGRDQVMLTDLGTYTALYLKLA